MKKRLWLLVCSLMVFMNSGLSAFAEVPDEKVSEEETSIGVEAPCALLMEASTGTILYEKDAHVESPPASVTKIMTMLLIFDALKDGRITLEDPVEVSEHASSMGGSQVYLETGEKQTVDTMLKCIAIASANDACVAMAEYVAGSEEAFVTKMNERAIQLGMENTNFVNCNGLDKEGHVTSAYDIALMSRELLLKYPQVHDYCTIWMDSIIHTTAKGSSEFGLNNTNKLIKQYEYCTGLKTGSTADAGFCVSATAKKDDMELIAVVLKGETSKSRFQDAKTMLNYGYANYRMYRDQTACEEFIGTVNVTGGQKDTVSLVCEEKFTCILKNSEKVENIEKNVKMQEDVEAPVKKGQILGKIEYLYENSKIGEIHLLAGETVKKAEYMDCVKRVWLAWLL